MKKNIIFTHKYILILIDAALPKPAPPSQKYLEGYTQNNESPWGSRTVPSPRSSKDGAMMDSDWLSQVKR